MKVSPCKRWRKWLGVLLLTLFGAAIFRAWLVPENVALVFQLLPGFCS